MTSKNKKLLEQAKEVSGVYNEEDIITKALKLFVDKYKYSGRRNKSFYELSKHIAGGIKGPKDLSYNKKYLEEIGSE